MGGCGQTLSNIFRFPQKQIFSIVGNAGLDHFNDCNNNYIWLEIASHELLDQNIYMFYFMPFSGYLLLRTVVCNNYFNFTIGTMQYWYVPGTYAIFISGKYVSNLFQSLFHTFYLGRSKIKN